jgi:hypothetical protein
MGLFKWSGVPNDLKNPASMILQACMLTIVDALLNFGAVRGSWTLSRQLCKLVKIDYVWYAIKSRLVVKPVLPCRSFRSKSSLNVVIALAFNTSK